ncbi:MAG: LPS export ABC transporter permease LptG [Alphaproteobacteria bacterium]|nr:LPS export ABC transporter permease LptG [Alphaproteobacteria bacterium]
MTFPATLYAYLARQMTLGIGLVFGALSVLAFMIDLVEMSRRVSTRVEVGFGTAFAMSLMKLPSLTEKILPFAILFGSIFAFARLSRSQELTILRAAGLSVWQILTPALFFSLLTGALSVFVYNPFAATMLSSYEQMENRYLRGQTSRLDVQTTGLWLRQSDDDGQSVIHALKVSDQGLQLEDVIIFYYDTADRFDRRIDAKAASLRNGIWVLKDAWETGPDRSPRFSAELEQKTTLTPDQIQDSFATPSTISFWELPRFIAIAESAGFSATRHRLHYYALVAVPFLFCAMTLIAATFALRLTRLGGVSSLILAGSLVGFLLYFVSDVTQALGLSGILPVPLAAWAPTAVALLLGAATLLHFEDG